jgi:hypothetical protein
MTQAAILAASGSPGTTTGFKNRIINGAFNVWQRGTSFTSVTSGQYTADRWQVSYRTAGVTVAQQNNTTYYAARLTNTDGSAQTFDFEQRIENTAQFSNSTYTLSFNAKASVASTVTVQVYANYGSGGSSQDTVFVGNVSVTTTRTGFTIALPFADMSSKTIGANSYVRVLLSPSALAASAWVEYDSVQVEAGATATNFDVRFIGTELQLCQRYYQLAGSFIGAGGSSDQTNVVVSFGTPMRSAPTTSANGALVITDGYTSDYTQSSANGGIIATTTLGGFVGIGNFTGLASGRVYFARYSNNNSIAFSAEL